MTRIYLFALQTNDASPKSGTLQVSPDSNDGQVWFKQEPGSASNIFVTGDGKYMFNNDTVLYTEDQKQRVGVLAAFDPSKGKIGQSGQGSSDETGAAFNWNVTDIINK
jgi:hypothetical protein